jgi:hypothetical protein
LIKKISSSKKGSSAGKVTNKLVHYTQVIFLFFPFYGFKKFIGFFLLGTFFRDTGLHKLVFNVLLDGTEVAYYADGQVVRPMVISYFLQCNLCFIS